MKQSTASALFAPFTAGAIELQNRILMAPMTRNRAPDRIPNDLMVEYYRQRAGAGAIITEASQTSEQGIGYPATPGIHNDRQVEGWRTVTDAVHAAGGRIVLQAFHVGRISHPSMQPDGALPVAPSAIAPEGQVYTDTGMQGFVAPRALELTEIPGVVAEFARAARNAKAAGFDGFEIHGANGYLVDQFLRDGSNRRTDAYGGSLENRIRFLREVTEAAIGSWSADRIGVRLSPHNPFNSMYDSDPATTFIAAAKALSDLGLAYLHVIEPANLEGERLLPAMREAFGGPVMTNGSYTRETAEAVIERGEADLVSFGALYLANPDLPQRLMQEAEFNTPDPSTFYGVDARGYIDYPAMT